MQKYIFTHKKYIYTDEKCLYPYQNIYYLFIIMPIIKVFIPERLIWLKIFIKEDFLL